MTVTGLRAYYTGEKEPDLAFPCDPGAVAAAMQRFEDAVSRIREGEFSGRSGSEKECRGCEFRYYCRRVRPE